MSYETFSSFAGTWGLAFLVVMFVVALIYALWPGNRQKFNRARQAPFREDEPSDDANQAYSGHRSDGR